MIYFIWAEGTPFIKVGRTISTDHSSADLRLQSFSAGCPYPLRLVHAFSLGSREADRVMERQIHFGLMAQGRHVRGEWFRLPRTSQNIRRIIKPFLEPDNWRERRTVRMINGEETIRLSAQIARRAGIDKCSHVELVTEGNSIVIRAANGAPSH